jgi:hypothetical protein
MSATSSLALLPRKVDMTPSLRAEGEAGDRRVLQPSSIQTWRALASCVPKQDKAFVTQTLA